jgi:hypothetical protein
MRKTTHTMFNSMITATLVIILLTSGLVLYSQKPGTKKEPAKKEVKSDKSTAAKKTKKESAKQEAKSDTLKSGTFGGLKWRSIGPAFTSGRIADFAVNPNNHSEWFVAVASGHVWKTSNNGTTFDPVFDGQKSYSIGVVVIDPNNTNVVWVGTG